MTHYDVLGVAATATAQDVSKAYRRAIRICHPDIAGADGVAETIRVNEAWEVLRDRVRRAQYDLSLGADSAQQDAKDGQSSSHEQQQQQQQATYSGPSDSDLYGDPQQQRQPRFVPALGTAEAWSFLMGHWPFRWRLVVAASSIVLALIVTVAILWGALYSGYSDTPWPLLPVLAVPAMWVLLFQGWRTGAGILVLGGSTLAFLACFSGSPTSCAWDVIAWPELIALMLSPLAPFAWRMTAPVVAATWREVRHPHTYDA